MVLNPAHSAARSIPPIPLNRDRCVKSAVIRLRPLSVPGAGVGGATHLFDKSPFSRCWGMITFLTIGNRQIAPCPFLICACLASLRVRLAGGGGHGKPRGHPSNSIMVWQYVSHIIPSHMQRGVSGSQFSVSSVQHSRSGQSYIVSGMLRNSGWYGWRVMGHLTE